MNNTFVLNLVPIASGGGLQNAKSFLETLSNDISKTKKCLILVQLGSEIEESCVTLGLNYISVRSTHFNRAYFEFQSKELFSNVPTCFTLFGPPPVFSIGKTVNIIGCAYSNLFYPEIPFWSYLAFQQRCIKEAIDKIRRYLIKRADFWIFETEALKVRAIELCNFPANRVEVVRMAPSKLVSRSLIKQNGKSLLSKNLQNSFKILYLSGPHPNKRLHLLPEIASAMLKSGCSRFTFITTMDESSPYAVNVIRQFKENGLECHIENIGIVPPDNVSTVIDSCDAMCTLSLLESFSNNFVEAWQMEKPLVVTDADWSRGCCGDAALYVDPTSATNAASVFLDLINQPELCKQLTTAGRQQLRCYNTPETKLEEYFIAINKAIILGPISKEERNKIRWP